jgi:hypothetical protein
MGTPLSALERPAPGTFGTSDEATNGAITWARPVGAVGKAWRNPANRKIALRL